MNNVQLIGRLTKDIELRRTQNDKAVTSFTLAVNRRTKDDGADFIQCTAWGKSAEIIAQYVHKGDKLGITGHIYTYNYENKNGQRVYVTEVVVDQFDLLGSKDGLRASENGSYSNSHVDIQYGGELPF